MSRQDGKMKRKGGVVQSKWSAMVASILMQCLSGSGYCFGIYSPLIKSSQLYDQQTLGTVAFFKDIGSNAGVIAGALYSYSPAGAPRLVLAAGAAQCFAGYLLLWLSVTGLLPRPPLPFICLFMLLASHSICFFNTADVVTAARNFPRHRGTAIGIMQGYLGLSGAILIQVYHTFYSDNPSYLLLTLSLLPTSFALLLMYFVKVFPPTVEDDRPLLNSFSLKSLITAGYLFALIILQNIVTTGSSARIFSFLLLLLLLSSPLSVIIKAHCRDSMLPSDAIISHESLLIPSDVSQPRNEIEADESPSPELRAENLHLFQAIRTCNFWLLFIIMACGVGSGLATSNNISQIGASLGHKSTETAILVSLWSIWNSLGRLGAGCVSDYFLQSRGCGRPLFMVIALATMSAGHVSIASGVPGALYVGYVLIGVSYGSNWSLIPTVTSEIFGLKHLGTLYNAVAIASPCGSYLLSVRMMGYIYDKQSHEGECVGNRCFFLSFLIMTIVTLLGSAAASVLFFRTRKLYEQVFWARLRHLPAS